MWTAPSSQGILKLFDQIACVHMSGLSMRSHMNAGQDGFRDKGSKQSRDPIDGHGGFGVSRVVDRLITPSARYLASSGIGSARLQFSCSPCLADLWTAPTVAAGTDVAACGSPVTINFHMWTAPSSQGVWQCFDQIACVHMSGLLMRSHMNAGQDGFRDTSSKQQSDLVNGPLGLSECSVSWID